MAILLNSAGSSAADSILKGLPCKVVFGASSFDVATIVDTWIEATPTIPGTTGSVKSLLSPASTVFTAGIGTGTYNDNTKEYTIASTTGLSVGDYLYLSHPSLVAGVYEIETIPSTGKVTIVGNPLNGANQTGISYQVAWSYTGRTGTAPIASNATGKINYSKERLQDGSALNADLADLSYVKDAPVGTSFVAIGGKSYLGGTVNTLSPSFEFLSDTANPGDWGSKGGVTHVELVNHSVQVSNQFKWGDSTTGEKTLSAAIASGFTLTSGDGLKYGRLLLKSKSGGGALGIDIQTLLDTTGPSVFIMLVGA
jgi:hypothetical protein